MNRAFSVAVATGVLVLVFGCKSKVDDKLAIRDGVIKHLSSMSGLNVNDMSVEVRNATENGDKAQAEVDIRAKNGDPSAPAMQFIYDLQKQGAEWVVFKVQAAGGIEHPAPGEMPQQGAMPAGHPPVNGGNGGAPAAHPDFHSILNSAPSPALSPAQSEDRKQQPAETPSAASKP